MAWCSTGPPCLAALAWHSHLAPVATGILVGCLAVWLFMVHRRLRTRMSARKAALVLAPKALFLLLLLLALLEPVHTTTERKALERDVLVLVDRSSSMDVRDAETTRAERADTLLGLIREAVPDGITLDAFAFDTKLHEGPAVPAGESPRGTDLAGCLLRLSERSDLSSYAAAILLTDGGDETAERVAVLPCPLHVVGIGSDPRGWNDISVGRVAYPSAVEADAEFEVQADVEAATADAAFGEGLREIPVALERQRGDAWEAVSREVVDLSSGRARVTFRSSLDTLGRTALRVGLPAVAGELSTLNNSRVLPVTARRKSLHVLFFTRELGTDFKMIRSELASDPGLTFTSLLRTIGERFTVQGERLPGDEDLEAGFPDRKQVLQLFDCIILGSFPAEEWRPAQFTALRDYVREGGAVILLGGQHSFGARGYGGTPLADLLPWRMTELDPVLLRGEFPVSVPLAASGHPVVAGLSELLRAAGNGEGGGRVTVPAVNVAGPLKPGAVGLLEVGLGGRPAVLAAAQRLGRGRSLALASNMLWTWSRSGVSLGEAFGRFWRQAVRNLSSSGEGGRLLDVKWDREFYRPGDEAVAEIRLAGEKSAAEARLIASLTHGDEVRPVPADPLRGKAGVYACRMAFRERGTHRFSLAAYRGETPLENYERELDVAPLLGEGARLERDDGFLRRVAEQGAGVFVSEDDVAPLIAELTGRNLERTMVTEVSLVYDSTWFLWLALAVLVIEWTIRRRVNLF